MKHKPQFYLRVIIDALSETKPAEHRTEGNKSAPHHMNIYGKFFKAEEIATTKALSKEWAYSI